MSKLYAGSSFMEKNCIALIACLILCICHTLFIPGSGYGITTVIAAEEEDALEDEDPSIPIFDDVYRKDWDAVKKRLDAGEWHIDMSDMEGLTLLHHAVMQGNNEAVLMLLKAGADKNVRCIGNGPTPYEMAKNERKIRPDVLERLRIEVAPRQPKGEDMIFSALRAAKAQDWQQVRFALIGIPKKQMTTVDEEGRTLLHYAAMHGSSEDLAEIVKKGMDRSTLDSKDVYGKLPYDYILKNQTMRNDYKDALMDSKTKRQYELLEAVRLHGNEPAVIRDLLSKGANPNDGVLKYPYNGYSPFLMAVRYGQQGIIPVLLEFGADINVQAPDGVTYPMMAVIGPHQLRYDLLDKCKTLRAEDDQGRNVLFYTIFSNKYGNVIWASRVIKDLDHQDKDGNTALMQACMRGKYIPAGLLYLLGADPAIKNWEGKDCYDILDKETFASYVHWAEEWLRKQGMPTDREGMQKRYLEFFVVRQR